MDWLWDNIVWLSAVLLGVLVVCGALYAFSKGRGLYRTAMNTQDIVQGQVLVLSQEAERAQTGMDRVVEGQEALAVHIEGLNARIAVAKVLASHASAAIAVLRSPLRYLGR